MDVILQRGNPLSVAHREALYPLFEQVFGIPAHLLKDYYDRGFWNPDYCPYTLFRDGQAIANVSVIPMKWMINGEVVHSAGIQSVMTSPAERGKGYMKKLMNLVLEEVQEKYSLVFLQTENPDLYENYGFSKVEEHIFTTDAHQQTEAGKGSLIKLDPFKEKDLSIINSCIAEQKPNSSVFTPLEYKHSLFLNLYNPFFAEKLYYCEPLNVLLIYTVEEETLKIYDVIGSNPGSLSEICGMIPDTYKRVEINFTPDQLSDVHFLTKKKEGTLMVKGNLDVGKRPVAFPITASF